VAVLCDPDYLKTAPPLMACAGLGDILGKLTCHCDWRLGHLLFGEYYCTEIAEMMQKAVAACFEAYETGDIDKKSPQPLIEALCLSGTAMAYAGNSRPASGAEHHIAHFWEMQLLAENRPQALHGIKVAFTTLVIIELYEKLLAESVDWARCEERAAAFSLEDYTRAVLSAYQNPQAAKDIVESAFFRQNNAPGAIRSRIALYREKWGAIQTEISENLPDFRRCAVFLENAGLPKSPLSLGISRAAFVNGMIYAKELRNRFTVLQIAADLGLLEKYAGQIAARYYNS
jgi:glycerol-1-phosphate dehydrogenase [NAD(P)+]